MNECVGNPRILSNILAYLDGRHLADVEVVSRGWSDVISGSSLWRVRCTVDIERHELLDYIGWHSVEKEQMRFKAPLSGIAFNDIDKDIKIFLHIAGTIS